MKYLIGAIAVLLAAGIWCGIYYWGSEDTQTCTVTDKDRTSTTDSEGNVTSVHRVYTEQCGILEVADALPRGQFDSADVYASLEPGQTYEVTTIGWRVPFFSAFPVVIDADHVN